MGAALIAYANNRIHGGKVEMKDLAPHEFEQETLEDMVNKMGGIVMTKEERKKFRKAQKENGK